MESVGSNSPPVAINPSGRYYYNHSRQVSERIIRALGHRLLLLDRTGPEFFILGATGNVYTVTLSAAPSCTCPDRAVPCKHILFVFLRVLGLPFDDPCLRRRTLRPCQVDRLLCVESSPESLASGRTRERFHQLWSGAGGGVGGTAAAMESKIDEEGAVCPVCLEEMRKEDGGGGGDLVTCSRCGNSVHGECMANWKRSRGRRAASCVVCRARWRERRAAERSYLNLAAYVSDDDYVIEAAGGRGGWCAG